jgi:hypothetical protein
MGEVNEEKSGTKNCQSYFVSGLFSAGRNRAEYKVYPLPDIPNNPQTGWIYTGHPDNNPYRAKLELDQVKLF